MVDWRGILLVVIGLASVGAGPATRSADERMFDALQSRNTQRVKAALAEGANANAKGPGGVTPLLWAVDRGSVELVNVLLEAKADVNAAAEDGLTPLIRAAAKPGRCGEGVAGGGGEGGCEEQGGGVGHSLCGQLRKRGRRWGC